MADQKLNQKTSLTDAQVNDDTQLIPIAKSSDGKVYTGTIAQAKLIFGTHDIKYTATGAEGTTLLITALAGKHISAILREAGPVFEVVSGPGTAEYTWDGTNIVFGAPLGVGERLIIFWKYP
jgi:hypothetical protein